MADPAKLIVACPETDADQLYATRFFAPDAYATVDFGDRKVVLLSPLEVDRGRKEARVDEVFSTEPFRQALMEQNGGNEPAGHDTLISWLGTLGKKEFCVPSSFPLGLARKLEDAGYRLHPSADGLYPQRQIKGEVEIQALREILRTTERAVEHGIQVLRESEPREGGGLYWQGAVLTSEILRAEIDVTALRLGATPANTIVAGGEQACDPHERGSGPLRAGELIIIDHFPRDPRTGYFGDLTRTVVKGQATDAQKQLWETVLAGQEVAFTQLQAGADGGEIQRKITAFFTENGYPTEEKDGRWGGFFHGLGHGLGLELHEAPRVSRTTLTPGQVFTVEPGLYYRGLGGVRHEDVVVIRENGAELLTSTPKPLEV